MSPGELFLLSLIPCPLEEIFKNPGEFLLGSLMTGAMAGSTSRALGLFASTPVSVLLGSLGSLVGELALSSRSARLTMDDLRMFVGRRLAASGPAFLLTGRWTHREPLKGRRVVYLGDALYRQRLCWTGRVAAPRATRLDEPGAYGWSVRGHGVRVSLWRWKPEARALHPMVWLWINASHDPGRGQKSH